MVQYCILHKVDFPRSRTSFVAVQLSISVWGVAETLLLLGEEKFRKAYTISYFLCYFNYSVLLEVLLTESTTVWYVIKLIFGCKQQTFFNFS